MSMPGIWIGLLGLLLSLHLNVHALEREGIGAINPSHDFPMEADNRPGRLWVISHTPIAGAAGMGVVGIHRLVIHPKFGNHILPGTVAIDADVLQDVFVRLATQAREGAALRRIRHSQAG